MERVLYKYRIGFDATPFEVRIGRCVNHELWNVEIGYNGSKDTIEQISMYLMHNVHGWILDQTVAGADMFLIKNLTSDREILINKRTYYEDFADQKDLELIYYTAVDNYGSELKTRPTPHRTVALRALSHWIF